MRTKSTQSRINAAGFFSTRSFQDAKAQSGGDRKMERGIYAASPGDSPGFLESSEPAQWRKVKRHKCRAPFLAPSRLCAIVLMLMPFCLSAATNDLTGALQRGLFEEEANRNLDAAAQAYQAVSAQFDKDRKLAATAIFRLGEVYRKQGRTNEAVAQYERIVREFADEQTLATLSKQNLAGLRPAGGGVGSSRGGSNFSDRIVSVISRGGGSQSDAAILKKIKGLSGSEQMQVLPTLVPDELLTKLLSEYQTTQTARAQKSADFGSDHPEIRKLDSTLKKLDEQIANRMEGIIKALEIRASAASESSESTYPQKVAQSVVSTDDEEKEIRRIQAMIQNSPDLINASRGPEGTPLCNAASKDQLRVAAFLLDHGADINLNGPLRRAASSGHKAMVELLLARGADVNAADSEGVTALQLAAENGFLSVTETLLNAKADPNLRDVSSDTALTRAAKKRFLAVMAKLLAHGADPNVASKVHPGYGVNPISEGRTMFGTPLHFAAARGDAAMATMLLTNRADLTVRNIYGETPLDIAAALGRTKIAELLLGAGADPNARASSESATPLFTACGYDHYQEVVKLLLEHGANPNVTAVAGQAGVTPLMVAASRKDAEVVALLLKHKADLSLVDARGKTALLNAVYSRSPEVVRMLLAAGADPDTTNESGYPVLMLSVSDAAQSKEVAAALIEAKADVNAKGPDGKTPLHWAAQNNRKNLVELLVNAGADVNLHDKSGMTPLDLAKGVQRQPQPGLVPVAPHALRPPIGAGSPAKTESTDIAALLRQHGALDELPDFNAIRVKRASMILEPTFSKDAASLNRFTLLETVLAVQNPYGRPTPWSLFFPDLANIRIYRSSPRNPAERKEIVVNILSTTNTIDCAKDMPLEFGDVVEIPERDHALSESPITITAEQQRQLDECTKRKLRVSASGGALEIGVSSPRAFLRNIVGKTSATQSILRSTSDLSRVKIKRVDPKSGKTNEFLVDAQKEIQPKDDLWLQDGDVIEVPNKL